ncbi:porin family protein [Flavobacterium tegetincola]|uniref:type IX secretion/gliding motility protein PorT/SprT n=1 Tax=Flavobacterium tegetincola TaxID=150172 RepID=UPI000418402F|nr:porin family protein [Flavobacterium tegetincola]
MKKFIALLIFISSFQAQAQMFGRDPIINLENFDQQRVYWGYYLGMSYYDFKFEYNEPGQDILVEEGVGFNVGLIGNLRLNDHFDLRFEPGLTFNQRNLIFPGFENANDALREVKSTYLHFPLLIKFSANRTGNIRPFVIGGLSTALNLSSNVNNKQDNSNNVFRMIKWTNFYEVGLGVDFYLEYFKFTPSLRGVFSLNDELIRDNDPNSVYTSNVVSMKTRGIFLNFTFQ